MKAFDKLIIGTIILFSILSCSKQENNQPNYRFYEEIIIENPRARKIKENSWAWRLPKKNWVKASSHQKQFVLASFHVLKENLIAEGSIVSFPGDGGSLEENIKRWAKQINLAPFSEKKLASFIKKQRVIENQKSKITIIDFTSSLSGNLYSRESMLSSIVEYKGGKLFTKLQGNKNLLRSELNNFILFNQSIINETP